MQQKSTSYKYIGFIRVQHNAAVLTLAHRHTHSQQPQKLHFILFFAHRKELVCHSSA